MLLCCLLVFSLLLHNSKSLVIARHVHGSIFCKTVLTLQVLGLGPVFQLKLTLANTSSDTPSKELLITFAADSSLYRIEHPIIQVCCVVFIAIFPSSFLHISRVSVGVLPWCFRSTSNLKALFIKMSSLNQQRSNVLNYIHSGVGALSSPL